MKINKIKMAKVIVSWTALPRAKDVFRSPHRPKAWTIALYITLRNKKGNIFCKDNVLNTGT